MRLGRGGGGVLVARLEDVEVGMAMQPRAVQVAAGLASIVEALVVPQDAREGGSNTD